MKNAWIKPNGQMIEVGYMEHNEWACDYLIDKYGIIKAHDLMENCHGTEYLHQLGWVRLLTWSVGKSKACGNCGTNEPILDTIDPSLNQRQKKALKDWCLENNYKYEDLF